MANNYKVKVQIDIVECTDTVTDAPNRTSSGAFEYVMSAEQAHSIDACEQILLQTANPQRRTVCTVCRFRRPFRHVRPVLRRRYDGSTL